MVLNQDGAALAGLQDVIVERQVKRLAARYADPFHFRDDVMVGQGLAPVLAGANPGGDLLNKAHQPPRGPPFMVSGHRNIVAGGLIPGDVYAQAAVIAFFTWRMRFITLPSRDPTAKFCPSMTICGV